MNFILPILKIGRRVFNAVADVAPVPNIHRLPNANPDDRKDILAGTALFVAAIVAIKLKVLPLETVLEFVRLILE